MPRRNADVVERTDGVTASFLKELVRRAVLESLDRAQPLTEVTADDLSRALDDLLDSAQSVTRTLLGVDVDPSDLASPGIPQPVPRPGMYGAGEGSRPTAPKVEPSEAVIARSRRLVLTVLRAY